MSIVSYSYCPLLQFCISFVCLLFCLIQLFPRSTRTDTLFPHTTLFLSAAARFRGCSNRAGGSSQRNRVAPRHRRPSPVAGCSAGRRHIRHGGSRHNRPPRCCIPTAERGRERRTGASFARPVPPLKSIKHFSKLTEAARLWKKESAARKSSGGRSLSAECK